MIRVPKSAVLAMMAAVPVAALGGAATAAAAQTLTASMDGSREVPKGDRDGRASARITTDAKRGRVCYRISLEKVGVVGAGHIHKGASGKAGAIVVDFFS